MIMENKNSLSDDRLYSWLRRELDSWRKEGIIGEEQAKAILSRYGISEEIAETKKRYGKLVTIIAILGTIILGVGVILFFASNWQEIPKWAKLLVIFGTIIASYHIGYQFRFEKQNYPRVGSALLFLGTILFGAGIFLIAQIFHIRAHYPNGVLFWAVGIFPLAYIIESRPILSLGLLNMTLWLGMESWFWMGSDADNLILMIGLYLIFGILVYSIGSLHTQYEKTRIYRLPYRIIGLIIILAASYIFTFGFIWEEQSEYNISALPWFLTGLIVTSLMALITCIANLILRRVESKTHKYEMIGLTALLILDFIFLLLPSPEIYPILFNIILFGEIIGIIFVGYLVEERALINIGLTFFAIDLFTRYFDFFWKLLPRALFFIIGGLILIAGGIYIERRGRKVIEKIMKG